MSTAEEWADDCSKRLAKIVDESATVRVVFPFIVQPNEMEMVAKRLEALGYCTKLGPCNGSIGRIQVEKPPADTPILRPATPAKFSEPPLNMAEGLHGDSDADTFRTMGEERSQ